jgi:hypothetical protein
MLLLVSISNSGQLRGGSIYRSQVSGIRNIGKDLSILQVVEPTFCSEMEGYEDVIIMDLGSS